MNELGSKLRDARLSRNLGLKQVSDDTKIRLHILKDIENGDFSSVPEVYMKSFIKTLTQYYKISLDSPDINIKSSDKPISSAIQNETQEVIKPKDAKASIQFNDNSTDEVIPTPKRVVDPAVAEWAAKYKKTYIEKPQKQAKIKKVNKVSLSNYILYGMLFVAIATAIAITIFSLLDNPDKQNELTQTNNSSNDTVKIEAKKDNLLSYFKNNDSLSLKAVAKDTAWVRLIIDDSKYIEEIMRPGDNKEWFASEQFKIDVGNAGAISFYRNGEQLPMFGRPGTVAKNIKITKDNIISIASIQPKDTSNIVKKPKQKKKVEQDTKEPPRIIESNIQEENNLLKRR